MSIDLFPREVIECGWSLMLEERERVRFCSVAAVGYSGPGLPLELIELPLGRFSPQMGTAGVTPPSTPSCRLLSPAPASQSCRATAGPSACCRALTPNRRGGERGSSRRGWTTVMSSIRLISALREGRLHCPFLHSRSPTQRPRDRHA